MFEITEYDNGGCFGQRVVSEGEVMALVNSGVFRAVWLEFASVGRLTTLVLQSGKGLLVTAYAHRVV